jgi:dynein heavy chain
MEEVFRWIGLQISWGFGLTSSETHRQLFEPSSSNLEIISAFLKEDGPGCIFIDCSEVRTSARRSPAIASELPKVFRLCIAISPPAVTTSSGVMYLLKVRQPTHFKIRSFDARSADNLRSASLRNDIAVGLINGANLLRSFEMDVEHFFTPHVDKCNTMSVSNKIEVQSALTTFKGVLAGSVTQHDSSVASKLNEDAAFSLLTTLKQGILSTANITPFKSLQALSKSPGRKFNNSTFAVDVMTHVGHDGGEQKLVQLLESWAERLHSIASLQSQRVLGSEDGPLVIADFWKSRLASVQAALSGIQSSSIQGLFCDLKELSLHRHRFIETNAKLKTSFDALEEACTKARDIVKFLSVLERCCEAMYQGTPKDVIDGMAGLLQTLFMARFLTQHFGSMSSLTQLFLSISNQLIINCRKYLNGFGKIWDQPYEQLSSRIEECLQVNVVFQKEFVKMKQSSSDLHQSSNGRHSEIDLDEALIFDRMEHFSIRLRNIRDLAETMFQFQTISHATLPGLQDFIRILVNSFAMLKKTLPSPMDMTASDRFSTIVTMVQNDVKISEQGILGFIGQAFSESTSAENALLLMKLLKPILQRDNLQTEVDAKYSTIFYRFGHDIKCVASIYEQFKDNPPIARHMSTVSGSVYWSRLLLKKIEEPMMKFQLHPNILNTPESRKIIRLYNRVARVLLEYEERWKRAWYGRINEMKKGFQKPLLTKVDDLWVFVLDSECMELVKDARYLERIGWEVPDSVMVYLHQESKIASVMLRVSTLVRSVNSSRGSIPRAAMDLFICLVRNLDIAMEPSLSSISLSSAILDSWLHKCENMVAKFKATLDFWKISMKTRVESGLSFMKKKMQFYAPTSCCSIEQFSMFQEAHIKKQSKNVQQISMQIENGLIDACQAIIHTAISFGASDLSLKQLDKAIFDWKSLYANRMYSAILHCVHKSFVNLKAQFLSENPAFVVEAIIVGPLVTIRPSIDDIQSVLNSCAQFITRATKRIIAWGSNSQGLQSASFFDRVASDLEVVKMILLMCGCFHGMKHTTEAFLKANLYGNQSIWIADINVDVPKFLMTNPGVHDFVYILDIFKKASEANSKLNDEFIVGSLKITTSAFKATVDTLISAGKTKYGLALHNYTKAAVENDLRWLKIATEKVQAPVATLADAAAAMEFLHEIRLMSSSLEAKLQFALTGYQVLATFGVQSSADAQSLLMALKSGWTTLNIASSNLSESLKSGERQFRSSLFVLSGTVSQEIANFCSEFEATGPLVPGISVPQACQRVLKFNQAIKDQYSRLANTNRAERLFGILPSSYAKLDQIRNEVQFADQLFSLYSQVNSSISILSAGSWNSVKNVPGGTAAQFFNEIFVTFQEYLLNFDKLPKAIRQWESTLKLKASLDHILLFMPLIIHLSSPSVMPRHWLEVSNLLKKPCNPDDPKFTVGLFLHSNAQEHFEAIEAICTHSAKECALEAKFENLTLEWSAVIFPLAKFKSKGPFILKGGETQELIEKLEEALMVLGGIMASRYVAFMRDKVARWSSMLANVGEVLENWLSLQATWIYLEAVFSSGDIAKQLPQESKRFSLVDKMFAKIMSKANEVQCVLEYVRTADDLRKSIAHMTEQLELCQKSLSGYLEQKRNQFFRFYFVSDPVILEILSQSSDPTAIQPHLQSVFDNLFQIEFSPVDIRTVLTMQSSEGEEVELSSPVQTSAHIEDWLNLLLEESKCTVNDNICNCVDNLPISDMHEYLSQTLGQVSLLGLQVDWTFTIESSIELLKQEKTALTTAIKSCHAIMNSLTELTIKQISTLVRLKLETAITIQVNQRDTAELLQSKKVKSVEDFDWQKITKFSWRDKQNKCMIHAADMTFPYNCEYLGCRDRLVITPLTERCYITLTQALGMCFGGAPAGPAGTGKTETVKDLGRALGMYVVVFNCSDQMDFRALGKIIKGLSQAGAWGCFDEFNRIDLPVLSVVAQQVQCIQSELRAKKKCVIFTDGCTISLHDQVGFFITMNPGYAGRQELPENLKSLFRGVTMMVPDRQSIIKVKLASCGFYQTTELSKKFHVLYKLCEQQLSKQPHYDFGLRNILSVLRTAANSKKENPLEAESTLLLRTLRDMNLSKFSADDVPLFLSLLGDLFPGISVEKNANDKLEASIFSNIQKSGLSGEPGWVSKIVELNSMVLVRHGVMLVGSAGSGKTCCMNVLRESLNEIQTPHREIRMNPKAITSPQMFGKLDSVSNDWTDGIFSAIWRKMCKTKNSNVWITLDGPVDAIWIENLNTVLDDNKLLTLANGDRIAMGSHMRLMFEVENLVNASPATVSRAGIVFLSESTLGWAPFITSWIRTKNSDQQAMLEKQIFAVVNALSLDESKCNCYMSVPFTSRLNNGLVLLEKLISHVSNSSDDVTETIICFAMAWCIGGIFDHQGRLSIDKNLKSNQLGELVPRNSSIFDGFVTSEGYWQSWISAVPTWTFNKGEPFLNIVVPTEESVRISFLTAMILETRANILLVGPSGSAKTSIIDSFIAATLKHSDSFISQKVNLSSAFCPQDFQLAVENWVEKRQGRTFGPPAGKSLIVFVDDCNLPRINQWKDQPTNEISRQLVEFCGCYNLERPGEWKNIVDLRWIMSMVSPGSSSNDVPHRLKRHFAVFGVPLPSNNAIESIFGSIIKGYSAAIGSDLRMGQLFAELPAATTGIWNSIQAKLLPTPSKFYYVFNLRDLSRIFQGIMLTPRSSLSSPVDILSLWIHECSRVFLDRITDAQELCWLQDEMKRIAFRSFSLDKESITSCFALSSGTVWIHFKKDLDESNVDESKPTLPFVYEPCSIDNELKPRGYIMMQRFNSHPSNKGKKLDLVLFKDVLTHIAKICRILHLDRGHALLLGVGGSGKQSIARLSAFISNVKLLQIQSSPGYTILNFLDDIKSLFRSAGVMGESTCLLLTDNDLKSDSFLSIVSSLLSISDVPSLFQKDENEVLLSDLRAILTKQKVPFEDSNASVMKLFRERVNKYFHIVVTFSPVGSRFNSVCREFPGFLNGCTISAFGVWPVPALELIAQKKVLDVLNKSIVLRDASTSTSFVKSVACIQSFALQSAEILLQKFGQSTYFTPKTYLTFLDTFVELYLKKFHHISSQSIKVRGGLEKLLSAVQDVAKMKLALKDVEKSLSVTRVRTSELLRNVTASTTRAEKDRIEVEQVANLLHEDAQIIEKDRLETEQDLLIAKPALLEAEAALKMVSSKDVQTLKKLANPPELIKRIFDGVLILKGAKLEKWTAVEVKGRTQMKDSYAISQKIMGESSFIESLINFPKESINPEQIELLQPYLDMPDFNFESGKKASGNVAGLCSWVRSMSVYFVVARDIAPKIAALQVAESKMKSANSKLQKAREELQFKADKVATMRLEFDAAMAEKQNIEDEADRTRRRLETADALILGLSDERQRWTMQISEFEGELIRLIGDVSICAAFLTYCGSFSQDIRDNFLQNVIENANVLKLPSTADFKFLPFLASDGSIGEWNLQGLPTDYTSIQNGVIVTNSLRYPFLIDPQEQAMNWIMNKERLNDLKHTSFKNKRFRSILEESMSCGCPLLVEDACDNMESFMDSIFDKAVMQVGSGLSIVVGDKECEFCPGFYLYMTSKDPFPALSPEVCAKICLINFSVTLKGLEDQLLGRIVQMERPELEETRLMLLEELTGNTLKIAGLQNDLLDRLSNSEGSLVEDESLVIMLKVTKDTVKETRDKVTTVQETQLQINSTREEYRPVAQRGADLYSSMTEIAKLSTMYQYSLKQFLALFDLAAAKPSVDAKSINARVLSIVLSETSLIFEVVSRGLFQKHKRVFAFILMLKVELSNGRCSMIDYQTLISQPTLPVGFKLSDPPFPINSEAWSRYNAMSIKVSIMKEIMEKMPPAAAAWRDWHSSKAPEENLSGLLHVPISPIHEFFLVSSLREDRVPQAAHQAVVRSLGIDVLSPKFDISCIIHESGCRIPVIFILSPGSDPTSEIEASAKARKIGFKSISMGQGQEVAARAAIDWCKDSAGSWLLFQNGHLGLNFMNELPDIIGSLQCPFENSFRIIITSESHDLFPTQLLHKSIKLVNEPPMGIRAGLTRSCDSINQDFLDSVATPEWKLLVYSIMFLHSVIQERRKFGPMGWNIPYEFNSGDMNASMSFCRKHFRSSENSGRPISWPTVKYMVCEIQYGGRVTDDYDRRLLNTIGDKWLSSKMMHPDMEFSKGYGYPPLHSIELTKLFINDLPSYDSHDIFGFQSNAETSVSIASGVEFKMMFSMTQPSSGPVGPMPGSVILETVAEFKSTLPSDFSTSGIKDGMKRLGGPKPLNIFLGQEISYFQSTLTTVRNNLRDIPLAMEGKIALGPELSDAVSSISRGSPPSSWTKSSWSSSDLGSWMKILSRRATQLNVWLTGQQRPSSLWLPGFFNPQGLLTAAKQEVARRRSWALNDVILQTKITKTMREDDVDSPNEGVHLHGLFLQGASWDMRTQKLVDLPPHILSAPLPVS